MDKSGPGPRPRRSTAGVHPRPRSRHGEPGRQPSAS